MRIPVLSFCIVLSFFSVLLAPTVLAANDNLPGYANQRFYPDPVTKTQQEDTSILYTLCKGTLGGFGLFECEGLRTHQVIAPESQQVTTDEVNNAQVKGISTVDQDAELTKLSSDLDTATTSAQVLGIADAFNWIFGGNQEGKGFIDSYRPANTSICTSSNSQECTQKLAVALMPASMQEKSNAAITDVTPSAPDSSPNPVDPNQSNEPTPVPGQYHVYFQNDPTYANLELPGPDSCRYIQAACGPFSVVNAMVNNGVTTIDNGQPVTPQYIVNHYYPFATCAGTGITAASNILASHGFTTSYNFNIDYASTSYKTPAQVANEFKQYTDAGWQIFGLANFYSLRTQSWIGHFFIVVKVENGKIYTLDPYYGYGQPIPFDQSTMLVQYKSAFRFKKT